MSDEDVKFSADQRARAHELLDKWLDDAVTTANKNWQVGVSGDAGELILVACSEDDGIDLKVRRVSEESL